MECKNLGKCCWFLVKGKPKKCPFLRYTPDGTTRCHRYRTRLGTVIGPGVKCGWRKDAPFNFIGCEYNVEHKPFFPTDITFKNKGDYL